MYVSLILYFVLSFSSESIGLTNTDEQEITKVNSYSSRLTFESRFESGNLRKAIQVMVGIMKNKIYLILTIL